jgi:hypothetical protein
MDKEEYLEKLDKGGMAVRAICELLGTPKEHIEKTMATLIEKAKQLPKTTVTKENVHKTQKQENGLFSSFVEFELMFDNLNALMDFCFNFMPSSIEVIEPEKITLDSHIITAWLNDLQGKFHQIDKIAKESNLYKQAINKQFNTIVRTNILTHLKQGDIAKKEIGDYLGINEESLKPWLDLLIKKGQIKLEKGKYKLAKPVKFKNGSKK